MHFLSGCPTPLHSTYQMDTAHICITARVYSADCTCAPFQLCCAGRHALRWGLEEAVIQGSEGAGAHPVYGPQGDVTVCLRPARHAYRHKLFPFLSLSVWTPPPNRSGCPCQPGLLELTLCRLAPSGPPASPQWAPSGSPVSQVFQIGGAPPSDWSLLDMGAAFMVLLNYGSYGSITRLGHVH